MSSTTKWYQRIPVISWLLGLADKVTGGNKGSVFPDYMLDPDAVVRFFPPQGARLELSDE